MATVKGDQEAKDKNDIANLAGAFPASDGVDKNTTNSTDYIYTYTGKDIVYAGGWNDFVYGGSGNDTLYGQGGKDTLYGGKDNDTFIYNNTSQSSNSFPDTIKDFESDGDDAPGNNDTINLKGIDANTGNSGDQDFNWYWESNSPPPSTGAQKLWFETDKQILWGDVDGSGWDSPDLKIYLPKVTGSILDYSEDTSDFIM